MLRQDHHDILSGILQIQAQMRLIPHGFLLLPLPNLLLKLFFLGHEACEPRRGRRMVTGDLYRGTHEGYAACQRQHGKDEKNDMQRQ